MRCQHRAHTRGFLQSRRTHQLSITVHNRHCHASIRSSTRHSITAFGTLTRWEQAIIHCFTCSANSNCTTYTAPLVPLGRCISASTRLVRCIMEAVPCLHRK